MNDFDEKKYTEWCETTNLYLRSIPAEFAAKAITDLANSLISYLREQADYRSKSASLIEDGIGKNIVSKAN